MRRCTLTTSALVCLAPLVFTLACSSSNLSSQPGVSSDEIVISELGADVGDLSAYEIVKRYNANWLEQRGPDSFQGPADIQVYVDNTGHPYGSASSLRQIRGIQVESIEYFTAIEAQNRFGLGNVAGAILVHTKSGV